MIVLGCVGMVDLVVDLFICYKLLVIDGVVLVVKLFEIVFW